MVCTVKVDPNPESTVELLGKEEHEESAPNGESRIMEGGGEGIESRNVSW